MWTLGILRSAEVWMVAEMERKFVRERQQVGIEAAKVACVYKGRKATAPVFSTYRPTHQT